MNHHNLQKEKNILLAAIRQAGAEVLKLQQAQLEIKNKANNDIVTEADLRVDAILKHALLSAFPNDGWLSEETVDNPQRLTKQRIWIVDPIDGTREYATGVPEYAVSAALVAQGQPVLAAVYNPATSELFYAIKDKGAWLNEQPISCKTLSANKLQLLASRSEYRRGEWVCFEQNHEVTQVGSIAYKLALIAAGRADATFSLGPKSEWDIAAGVLLVLEAGGEVCDKNRQPFQFNNQNILVNGIVAAAKVVSNNVFLLIANNNDKGDCYVSTERITKNKD